MTNTFITSSNKRFQKITTQQTLNDIVGELGTYVDFEIFSRNDDFLVSTSQERAVNFDAFLTAEGPSAMGNVLISGPVATETVTINGLVYTGVNGPAANFTEFQVDGGK